MSEKHEDVIETLYRLYEQSLYREAWRVLHDEYLAEDAVHEAFLRLIRNRYKISDPASPAARRYVYKTARSAALDLYRRQKRHRDNCCTLEEAMEKPDVRVIWEPDAPLAQLAELPDRYAAVMRCLFLDGLSTRETAAVLGISEALVRKRCERARKLLKNSQTNSKKEIQHGG